jgi:eukaryotic-like serine/threonine-protein kinase
MQKPDSTLELAAGQQIAGRYRLERLLGEGGMGAVWGALHVITRKMVALKFLKAAPENQAARRRFLREARAASAVVHPNVVEIHDIVEHEGVPVMVMDLLLGESLAAKLARDQIVPLEELAAIMLPVLSAIGTAHAAGVVHRDIKPDNVFLCALPDGTIEPKVLDFGIAKLAAREGEGAATASLTHTGALLGTPYYMAPEQVFGEKDVDQRADVWAVGVMLYECISGKRPIDGDNLGQLFKMIVTGTVTPLECVAPNLPSDVTCAVSRMLIADRNQRASDLREIYEIFKRYASVNAASFGSAAPVASSRSSASISGPLNALTSVALAPTGSTAGVARAVEPTIRLPMRPRRLGWLLGGALAAVIGAGVLKVRGPGPTATAPAATRHVLAEDPARPRVRARLDDPIVPSDVSASISLPVGAASAPAAAPVRRSVPAIAPRPSASSSPVPSAKPPATAPTRQPGQVVEESPF